MNNDWIKLQAGMILRTRKEVRTSDRCWNRPDEQYYATDTVVVPMSGNSRGDTGAKVIGRINDGEFVSEDGKDNFFREGHTTACPYDRGSVDPQVWEVIGQMDDQDKISQFYRQAPHWGAAPLVITTDEEGKFVFVEGIWDGWNYKLPPRRAESEERTKRDTIRKIGRAAAGYPTGPLS